MTDRHRLASPGRKDALVLFDFDGTLTHRDSLAPFLRFVLGRKGLIRAMIAASPWLIGYVLRLVRNDTAKARLLSAAFQNRSARELDEKGRLFARDVIPALLREDMMRVLTRYQQGNYRCVLVSASLDFYLAPWAEQAGFDALLCSSLARDETGRLTDGFKGANCHGEEKLRRIRLFMTEHDLEDASPIIAYGDSSGDVPMMRFATRAWRVRKHGPVPFSGP